MSSNTDFKLQEENGKLRLILNGQCVGAALQDHKGYWDAEISNRIIGRFQTIAAARKALWDKRELALKQDWQDYPYYER